MSIQIALGGFRVSLVLCRCVGELAYRRDHEDWKVLIPLW